MLRVCRDLGKPAFLLIDGVIRPSEVADWIEADGFKVLKVAWNRATTGPGIGERAERLLIAVFRRVADG